MQVGEYRVAIISEQDPLSMGADIYVYLRGTDNIKVLQNGTWTDVAEGTSIATPTLRLPSGAIDALMDAVDRFRGAPSHARTEAAVLREWVTAERARVDRLVDLAVMAPPRIFDFGLTQMPTGEALKASSPLSRKP